MSDTLFLQYVGFESSPLVRTYTFSVRGTAREAREFTFTIANEAFSSHRARYQDAPDICSLKLRRELAIYANNPPNTHFSLTDAELEEYRSAHAHMSRRNPYTYKEQGDN